MTAEFYAASLRFQSRQCPSISILGCCHQALGKLSRSITIPAEGEFMANPNGLASIVSELEVVRTSLVDELRHVDAALSILGKSNDGSSRRTLSASARRRISLAQKARWARRAAKQTGKMKTKRTMSASARRKIAAAQRARWAKLKGQAAAPKPKRHISAAGKKRIAAAARARWAKIRAEKKAA